jgi:hypothetical protein
MKFTSVISFCLLLLLFGCGQSPQPRDPVGVIQAEIQAINRGQADVAAGYFAENGQIISAWGQPTGKDKVKSFISTTLIKLKSHAEVNALASDGSKVTGTITWSTPYEKFPPFGLKAVVQDGKIASIEWGTAAK